jgi:carbonic anhydrase
MKTLVLAALAGVLALPVAAESGGWVGYVTFAPGPPAATVGLMDNDLVWLRERAKLTPTNTLTFLGRRDGDHWMALTNRGSTWLLQIHDESAQYNFRAVVQPMSGKMVVERGVDWAGSDRQADADRSAAMAVGYVSRARRAADLFPQGATLTAPAPMTAAAPMTPAVAMMTPTEPGMAQPVALIPDPMLGSGGLATWQTLVDGNLRFVSGKVTHPDQSMARVQETAKGQHPFAIVVACSDSRVPPEVLFDQGIGDLFVVRTAGEVVTEVELGSIEYAVEHLGASYLVVLGHKRCGAVEATLKGGDLPPNLEAIAAQIRPAVEAARFFKGDLLDNAVRENTKVVLAKIQGTPALAEALHAGKLNLKAAYYDIDTGKVAALP